MTVNLYLNDKIYNFSGFKIKINQSGNQEMSINDMYIFVSSGCMHITWNVCREIPEEFREFIEWITYSESIPCMGQRESGVYFFGKAKCELMPRCRTHHNHQELFYDLRMEGTVLEDIRALLHKVKTGAIRPEYSYDGVQQGRSNSELERALAELESERILLLQENARLLQVVAEYKDEVRRITEWRRDLSDRCEILAFDLNEANKKLARILAAAQ